MDDPKEKIKYCEAMGNLGASLSTLMQEYDSCLDAVTKLRAKEIPDCVEAGVVVMDDGTPYCFIQILADKLCAKENLKTSKIPDNWEKVFEGFASDECYRLNKLEGKPWNRRGYGMHASSEKIPSATIDVLVKDTADWSRINVCSDKHIIKVMAHPSVVDEAYELGLKVRGEN